MKKALLLAVFALLPITGKLCLAGEMSGFTYQGQLSNNGVPVNGWFDFSFRLADGSEGGAVGSPLLKPLVLVTKGLFTVVLDFGDSPWNGTARWLEIGVKTNGSTDPEVVLTPRQPVTIAPQAAFAIVSGTAGVASNLVAGAQLSNVVLPGSVILPGTVSSNQIEAATDQAYRSTDTNTVAATVAQIWTFNTNQFDPARRPIQIRGGAALTNISFAAGPVLRGSLMPVIDVTQPPFNADPTGAADCSGAFTNALAAAIFSNGWPNRVYVPPGTYRLSRTVLLPANSYHEWMFTNRLEFVGAGRGSTYIDASAVTGDAFQFNSPNVGGKGPKLNNFLMKGFTICGPDASTGGNVSQGAGIYIGCFGSDTDYRGSEGGWYNTFEDLDISGFRDLFCTTNCIQTTLRNCRFWTNYSRAAVFSCRSDTLYIENCALGGDWHGGYLGGNPTAVNSNVIAALVCVGHGVGVWASGGDGWNWSKRAVYADTTPVHLRDLNIENHWGEDVFYITNSGFNGAPFTLINCKVLCGTQPVGQLSGTNRCVFHLWGHSGAQTTLINNTIDGNGPRPFRIDDTVNVYGGCYVPRMLGRAICTLPDGWTPEIQYNTNDYRRFTPGSEWLQGRLDLADQLRDTPKYDLLTGNRLFVQGGPNNGAIDIGVGGAAAYSVFLNGETIPGGNNNVSLTFGSYWADNGNYRTKDVVFRNEGSGFNVGIGTASPQAKLHVAGSMILSNPAVPATSSSSGSPGQIAWDGGFVYVCTATNTWRRTALQDW